MRLFSSAARRDAAARKLADEQAAEEARHIWTAPHWGSKPLAECLEELRIYVEKQLSNEIGWYAKSIRKVRPRSRGLRAATLALTGIGGLIPIVDGMNVVKPLLAQVGLHLDGLQLGQTGYLFLALGGSIALLDKFFGFSSAWMRYVSTMITLEKQRDVYRLEWVALSRRLSTGSTGSDADADVAGRLIELAKTTLVQMKAETDRETTAWITEFQSNLAQFEKDMSAQREAARPGAIDVRITDGASAEQGIHVFLDQMRVETVTGTLASVGSVTPGLHKVTVTTRSGPRTYSASQMVDVRAATVSRVEVTLGLPTAGGTGSKTNGSKAKDGAPASALGASPADEEPNASESTDGKVTPPREPSKDPASPPP